MFPAFTLMFTSVVGTHMADSNKKQLFCKPMHQAFIAVGKSVGTRMQVTSQQRARNKLINQQNWTANYTFNRKDWLNLTVGNWLHKITLKSNKKSTILTAK